MAVEEDDADQLEADVAELEVKADEAAEARRRPPKAVEEEHERSREIPRRHGIVSAEPDRCRPARRRLPPVRMPVVLLRKPTSQLADPERSSAWTAANGG
jgi:hypothetical protein